MHVCNSLWVELPTEPSAQRQEVDGWLPVWSRAGACCSGRTLPRGCWGAWRRALSQPERCSSRPSTGRCDYVPKRVSQALKGKEFRDNVLAAPARRLRHRGQSGRLWAASAVREAETDCARRGPEGRRLTIC